MLTQLSLSPLRNLKLLMLFLLIYLPSSLSTLHAQENSVNTRIVAGKAVHLSLPKKYCPMTTKNASDKLLLDGLQVSIKGVSDLLLQFADCEELKNWRSGKRKFLNNLGNYLTPTALKAIDMQGREGATLKEICNLYKKQGAELLQSLSPEIKQRLKDGFNDIQINQMKLLGIVHEDENMCAAAAFQRLKTDDNTLKDQVSVFSATILNGRLVFSYLYSPNNDRTVVDKLTKRIRELNLWNQYRNNKKAN